MVRLREDFTIYALIDLFYCDMRYFEDKKNKEKFNKKTYPILLLDTDNLSTFIAVACLRFISIMESDTNLVLLKKYLQESTNLIYEEEVLKIIDGKKGLDGNK
ncbi:hypothetical protein [Flavobacterium hydatis]|uniref:Uncharacterized protein n=2 Tax=Flavobacterium hydatis TaxID=991 RepID=A0ABX4CIJ6_FLAHY|nr:hypothetical protein [Flavobacterium hydatis]OXA95268.1 hypothetical protein B0A62_08125 [Flavobacterium hydatis]